MDSRQAIVLGVSTFFFIVASIFVGLYLSSCLCVVKKVRLADYLMLLAWMLDFGMSFSLFYAVGKGLGLRSTRIKPQDEVPLNKATYVFEVLYDPTSMAAKSSVLIFFLALTRSKRAFYWANYITLIVVNAVGLALTVDQIFRCHPVSAGFQFDTLVENCAGIFPSFLASSPYNIATDVAILLIPIPLLTQMTLPFRQKLILVFTFGIAILVIVVDLIRIGFLESTAIIQLRAHHVSNIGEVGNMNYTHNAAFAFMLSCVEINMVIICACVPSLKPLAARISPFLLRSRKEASQLQKGELEESPPGQNRRGEGVTGEMMELITSHPETVPTAHDTRNSYTHDAPIINVLNMEPASMPKLNNKGSFPPNVLITTLFFLWGVSYGFINVLNIRFGTIVQLDEWESDGLHAAYFGGYLIGPLLVGRLVLKRLGFAAAFITGLYIYACGTLLFWPSAVLGSLPTFIVSNVIVGAGLGLLETTANLFISICGPLEYSEIRLCVAQAFQGIGQLLATELGERVIFKSTNDVTEVVRAQWAYLAITFFDVLLSIIFYYVPIPEAPDDDLKELADHRPENNATVLGIPVFGVTLGLAVWSQFLYVAGQEVHIVGFDDYVASAKPSWESSTRSGTPMLTCIETRSTLTPPSFGVIGNAAFILGRLLTALIQWLFLKPRWTLLVLYIGVIIFGALCMHTTGFAAASVAIMVFFFESGIFPIIFAIALRGTAQHAKTAATLLAASISGGAIFPFARRAAVLTHNEAYSYSIVVALWSAGALFPLYLNLVPAAKRQVDPLQGEFLRED